MMQCISPVWIRSSRMSVPCGKCGYCLQNKRLDWAFRLEMEAKFCVSSYFVTLTYSDVNLPVVYCEGVGRPTLVKDDLQKFVKDLRYRQGLYSERPLRFYGVGEYGSQTRRPHYHIMLFDLDRSALFEVHKVWTKGSIDVGYVTPESCNYVCKYMITKEGDMPGVVPPFSLMSRRPGIGDAFRVRMFEFYRQYGKPLVPVGNGKYRRLARFYKDKFFTSKERELWRLHAIFRGDELEAKAVALQTEVFGSDYMKAGRYLEHQKNWHEVNLIEAASKLDKL